jgi:hypothetical protein
MANIINTPDALINQLPPGLTRGFNVDPSKPIGTGPFTPNSIPFNLAQDVVKISSGSVNNILTQVPDAAFSTINNVIGSTVGTATNLIQTVPNAAISTISNAVGAATGLIQATPDIIKGTLSAVGNIGETLLNTGEAVGKDLLNAGEAIYNTIVPEEQIPIYGPPLPPDYVPPDKTAGIIFDTTKAPYTLKDRTVSTLPPGTPPIPVSPSGNPLTNIQQIISTLVNPDSQLQPFIPLVETIRVPEIIGLPPLPSSFSTDSHSGTMGSNFLGMENDMIMDTFPILEIEPCISRLVIGLDLYELVNAWDRTRTVDLRGRIQEIAQTDRSYIEDMLQYYGVDLSECKRNRCLKAAVMAEGPIQESFSNDFGDSVFSEISKGVASSTVADIASISGITNKEQIGDLAKKGMEMMGLGKEVEKGKEEAGKVTSGMSEKTKSIAGNILNAVTEAALGHGVGYPQVWRSAAWNPNYSFTIRLYNPLPGSYPHIERYIIGPLACLMSFVVPRSNDGKFFFAPWYCKFRVRGLIPQYAGYIKNISVIKGGDNNQIGWNQKASIVDVKIDFGMLYQTMVGGKYAPNYNTPQLVPWLKEFEENRGYNDGGPDQMIPSWYVTSYMDYQNRNPSIFDLVKNAANVVAGVLKVNEGNVAQANVARDTQPREGGLLNQLTGMVVDPLTKVVNGVGTIANELVGAAGDLTNFAVNTAGGIANTLVGTAGQILNTAGQIIGPLANTVAGVAGNVLGTANGLVSNLTNVAGNVTGQATSLIGGVTQNVAGGMVKDLGNYSTSLLSIPGGLLNNASTLTGVANDPTCPSGVVGQLLGEASSLTSTAGTLTSSLGPIANNLATTSINMVGNIGLPATGILQGVATASTNTLTNVAGFTADTVKTITNHVPTGDPKNPNPRQVNPVLPVTNYKSTSNKSAKYQYS